MGGKKMADCDLLKGCLFFNDKMPMESGVGSLYKQRFCQGDNSKCARYTIATSLGREKVPHDLYPNMDEKAKEIIAKG